MTWRCAAQLAAIVHSDEEIAQAEAALSEAAEKTATLMMPGPFERARFLALELTDRWLEGAAGMLVAADLGCLLNLGGTLKRQGSPIAIKHIAELLAGEP